MKEFGYDYTAVENVSPKIKLTSFHIPVYFTGVLCKLNLPSFSFSMCKAHTIIVSLPKVIMAYQQVRNPQKVIWVLNGTEVLNT